MVVRPGGGFRRWGGLRVTHYNHMHTSRGEVCLGAWGFGGMYVIIVLSRLCREESLKGSMHKKKNRRHWRHGPNTTISQSPGGGGGGHIQGLPPPP